MCFFNKFKKSKINPVKNPEITSVKNMAGWLNVSQSIT